MVRDRRRIKRKKKRLKNNTISRKCVCDGGYVVYFLVNKAKNEQQL